MIIMEPCPMFNKFYGGVLPDPSRYWCEYPLNNGKILEVLAEEYAPSLLTGSGSAIDSDDFMAGFIKALTPEPVDVIEIGTFMGLGSALLASYSRTVCTFDIWYRNAHRIWDILEVEDRINCYTGDQQFIDDVINDLKNNPKFNFNFAFIDGMHKVENVRHDFELVKFCGRVLFHDANIEEIRDFIIEIGGIFVSNDKTFGYWQE